jgi:nicotinate-nucleotide pyrophosphorylase (carboxylating)
MRPKEILARLLEFLDEDVGSGDITSSSLLNGNEVVEAEIVAKGDGVLSGLEEAGLLLEHFGMEWTSSFKDGDEIKTGALILRLKGNASKILALERVLLNILMRMSGIATATRRLVNICRGYNVRIAGTRKTTPGFGFFEKKAMTHGGGETHRMGLYDAILIKDNHVSIVGLEESIKKARAANPGARIELEVSSWESALLACKSGVNVIMLDNMSAGDAARAIESLVKKGLRKEVVVEISGGITPENIVEYARLKPDVISTGYITTRAEWVDMSLKIRV